MCSLLLFCRVGVSPKLGKFELLQVDCRDKATLASLLMILSQLPKKFAVLGLFQQLF